MITYRPAKLNNYHVHCVKATAIINVKYPATVEANDLQT